MPRNITVTFADGTNHVYQNAPDNVTPDQVSQRAQQEFNKPVAHMDGGKQAAPQADGMLGTLIRSAANGITGGWADKAAAGLEAVIPGIGNAGTQTIYGGHGLSDAYNHNQQIEHAQTQADETAHPWVGAAGNIGGAVTLAAGTAGLGQAAGLGKLATMGKVGRVAAAVAPDVAYGASYGAGQSQAQTLGGQAEDTGIGGIGGLAGHVAGNALGKVVGGIATGVTDPIKRALNDAGVNFTPGQLMGGAAQKIEQSLTSIPFGGTAIKNRLAESGQQWNNATLDRALQPIGAKIPDGAVGTDAFAAGQHAIDGAYDAARSGMQFQRTPEFDQALSELKAKVNGGGLSGLTEPLAKQFNGIVDGDILGNLGHDGVIPGDAYKQIISDLKKEASGYSQGQNNFNEKKFGGALQSLVGIVDGAAKQVSDPAAVAKMQAADKSYGLWALAQKAADTGGAANPGSFTPAQYLRAVKAGDGTVRNRAYSSGNAFDQAYGEKSQNALGSSLPNSFTADRLLAFDLAKQGVSGLGLGALGHMAGAGAAAAPAGIALPAVSAGLAGLYSKPANALLNKAAFGGGAIRAQIGQKVNALAPTLQRVGAASGATLAIQHGAHD